MAAAERPTRPLFLSQTTGGSGTSYDMAAAIARDGRRQATNAVFNGDRLVPKTIYISDGLIAVRFLDRGPEDPMTVKPSVAKTLEIELVGGHLEVFEP